MPKSIGGFSPQNNPGLNSALWTDAQEVRSKHLKRRIDALQAYNDAIVAGDLETARRIAKEHGFKYLKAHTSEQARQKYLDKIKNMRLTEF